MVLSKYGFPLPNNGERYDLSEDELVKILEEVYYAGWDDGKQWAELKYNSHTTAASFEDIDDNTRWKEVWIK